MLRAPSRRPIDENPKPITINTFGGMDISSSSTTIPFRNTPDIKNMIPNSRGDLDSRTGWVTVKSFTGKCNGLFKYSDTEYIAVYGDKIYSSNDLDTSLYTTVNAEHDGFVYNGKLYLVNGSKYLVYDGTAVAEVVGYIPTLTIATPTTGGGTAFEERNLISNSYKQDFQNDGVNKDFQLLDTDIDADPVIAWVLNTSTGDYDQKAETTHFTVNRTTGKVTFITAPPDSATVDGNDVVKIQWTKDLGYRETIEKCTTHTIYGGNANVSVWLTGNPDKPNYDYNSKSTANIVDPTYFPINNFDVIGFDDPIIGYEHYYDRLVILKKNESWVRSARITTDGITYDKEILNATKGCETKKSIALVNNFPWFLSKQGYAVVSPYQQQSEKNVDILSDAINYNKNLNFTDVKGLLETDLSQITSIDYDDKLWISDPQNDQVWVCDYNQVYQDSFTGKNLPQFYRFTNIKATHFMEYDHLYFGTSDGKLRRMKSRDEANAYYDDDTPIDWYWTMKISDFDTPEFTDNVPEIHVTFLGYASTHIDLYTRTTKDELFKLRKTDAIQSFVYSSFSYSSFVYGGILFPKTSRIRVKLKNSPYSQIKIAGNYGEPVTLVNIKLSVSDGKENR